MDGSLFDRLTQIAGASRRKAIRMTFGGAALASVGLATSTLGGSARKKKCKKKKCPACEALEIGEVCQTNLDCCTNETNAICSIGQSLGPDAVCCGGPGFRCTGDDQCCAAFICDGGQCVLD